MPELLHMAILTDSCIFAVGASRPTAMGSRHQIKLLGLVLKVLERALLKDTFPAAHSTFNFALRRSCDFKPCGSSRFMLQGMQ